MSTTNQVPASGQGRSLPSSYRFGPFVLDTLQHALLKEGKPVALTPKTYDTLLVLVQNRGRVLSKDELMNALWPDSFVEEANLTQQVSMIRKALGDSSGDPRYIHTVPGRGYRFTSEVEDWTQEKANSEAAVSPEGIRNSDVFERTGLERESSAKKQKAFLRWAGPRGQKVTQSLTFKATAAGVLLLAFLAIGRSFYSRSSTPPLSLIAPRTLAILPLQNLKQDPANDFLGFSLADAVITKLDYVNYLTTRPSAAVEKYRNQVIDIPKVAGDLNVDTLLIGSFVRDRDDLRITYQLVDGKSQKILGRGTIDLKYDKLLRVQDTVALQIVKDLELNLSPAEAERIKPEAPVNALAYEYFLRGVDLHSQHRFPLAIKMLEKSTEIDANYAPAWAYLGASYTSDAAFEFGGREQYRRAQAAYERALTLQPSQLEAEIFLANNLVDTGKVEQAVLLLRDALKTNPNHADLHWELGYAYRFAGMLTESVAECESARRIDPQVKANGSMLNAYLYLGQYDNFLGSLPDVNDSSFLLFYRGFGEFHKKDLERAAEDFQRAYETDPSLYAMVGEALRDSIAHRTADGLEILHRAEQKITQRGVGDPEGVYKIAQAYSVLGDKVAALRVLRRSVDGGFFSYPYLENDPLLTSLHGDPEFNEILSLAHQRYEAFRAKFF